MAKSTQRIQHAMRCLQEHIEIATDFVQLRIKELPLTAFFKTLAHYLILKGIDPATQVELVQATKQTAIIGDTTLLVQVS